ncbi:ribosomal protein S18 acetylase RimI-like enzyme [Mesocricetibacter intestinalis]|uniref:Ribosomal protein S18 acetylase RimI-like enzyme n=1 Tax=Mesocricetibacter intestinalis TaxID=1521930 RepID=A0A4R6VBX9_9PAST|nr:GNAT family N-acetyltransferase [Mesocricetibacter intestinalis]TDQ59798.1 ribosomal protein S18 acetylase RimI-like enzyme [Mesocricetibacter intestinalis]
MQIRRLTISDLPQLRQIGIDTFRETFSCSNSAENMSAYLTQSFSLPRLQQELENPHSEFYFAERDNRIAGYLKLNSAQAQTELQDKRAVEIERIYVLQCWQGKGIGQKLYEFALNRAREQQAHYLWLGVWEHNHKALAFYRKNGFTEFDRHIFLLGEDKQRDIMMKRPLLIENQQI